MNTLSTNRLFDVINDEKIDLDKKVEIVRDLLQKGANPNDPRERHGISDKTPLSLAYEKGYPAIVRELRSESLGRRMASLDVRDNAKQTLLHLAVMHKKSEEVKLELVNFLLEGLSRRECEALLDAQSLDNRTALHGAVQCSDPKDKEARVVKKLIEYGAAVDAETEQGFASLYFAARSGNLAAAKVLVENGAFVDSRENINKNSAKKRAIKGGHLEVAYYLAQQSQNRMEHALVQANHPRFRELLMGDIARSQKHFELARQYYEKLLREGTTSSRDIRLKVCCLKKLGDLMLSYKKRIEATQLYSLALALYKQLAPARQYNREAFQLFKRLERVSKSLKRTKATSKAKIHFTELYKWAQLFLSEPDKRAVLLNKIFKRVVTDMSMQRCIRVLNDKANSFTGDLIKECMQVLGLPPCSYAVISLGSMSWAEMLLSADLAFGVLLHSSKEKNKKYFQELIHLFVVKLLTFIKVEQLPCYEGHSGTPAAKVFLGHILNPLEEHALLGTPREIAEKQKEKKLFKAINFVYGSENSEKNLVNVCRNELSAQLTQVDLTQLLFLLEADLVNFELGFTKEKELKGSLYLKRELYHFLSGVIHKLSLYHSIAAEDSWARLKMLGDKKIISENGYDHLCRTMNAIMQLKLKRHQYSFGEVEEVKPPIFIEFDAEDKANLIDILRVLLPFHKALKEFCYAEGRTVLNGNNFYDEGVMSEGEACERLFNYAEAEKCYDGVVQVAPMNLEARRALNRVLYKRGSYEDARSEYDDIFGDIKFNLSAVNLAVLQHEAGIVTCAIVKKILRETAVTVTGRGPARNGLNNAMTFCNSTNSSLRDVTHPLFVTTRAANQKIMGDIERLRGNLENARICYKDALGAYEKLYGEYGIIQPLEVIKATLAFAEVQLSLGVPRLALDFYEEAGRFCKSPIYKYVHGETHLEMQEVLDAMEVFCKKIINSTKDLFEAIEISRETINVCEGLMGEDHLAVGKLSKSLVETFFAHYNEKIKAFDFVDPTDDEQRKLAFFLERTREFLEKAEKIYQKAYGEDHAEFNEIQRKKAEILILLSEGYLLEGKGKDCMNKAEVIIKKLEIRTGRPRSITPSQIDHWKNRGRNYLQQGIEMKSPLSWVEVTSLQKEVTQEQQSLAQKKDEYETEASNKKKSKKTKKLVGAKKESYEIAQKALLEKEEKLRTVKEVLVAKEMAYEEAEKAYVRILEHYKSCACKDQVSIVGILDELALVYQYWEKFPEAKDYYRQALVIYEELVKDDPAQQDFLIRTLGDLAQVCEQLKEYEEANTYLKLKESYAQQNQ